MLWDFDELAEEVRAALGELAEAAGVELTEPAPVPSPRASARATV
jgi:hypothetical protein